MATQDSSLSGLLMESVISLESSLGQVEKKINSIFSSINSVLEFSSNSGNTLILLKDDVALLKNNLVFKEDLMGQFCIIHENIRQLTDLFESKSVEIFDRLQAIEEIIKDVNSGDSSKKKGRFGK